jgi:hypothetical protein
MQVSASFISAALVAALSGLGASGQAHASGTIHGSICKAYSNTLADHEAIFSGSTGTANHDSVYERSVICPVTRRVGSNGVTVWVEGGASSGGTVSCTLTSRYGGIYRGAKSFSSSASYFDQGLTMSAAEAPYWAKLDLICKLPVSGRGRIAGISLND